MKREGGVDYRELYGRLWWWYAWVTFCNAHSLDGVYVITTYLNQNDSDVDVKHPLLTDSWKKSAAESKESFNYYWNFTACNQRPRQTCKGGQTSPREGNWRCIQIYSVILGA